MQVLHLKGRRICHQSEVYTNQKCFIIPQSDPYLLGILNSRLTFFLFRIILPKLRGEFYEPSYVYLKDFPINSTNNTVEEKALHDTIENYVEDMLRTKALISKTTMDVEIDRLQRRCDTLDRQIDEAVYALYGLTVDEIQIIESNN